MGERPPHGRERGFVAVVVAVYAVIGLAIFRRVLSAPFTGDDWLFLGIVHQTPGVSSLVQPLAGRFFRPIVVLIYVVNDTLFGLTPLPYHLTLLGLHIANACLLFFLARRLSMTAERLRPFLAGLLFLVFAGHSEAVSWVAGAADPAMTVCLLGCLVLMSRSRGESPASVSDTVFGAILALVALLSKESAIVIPVVALLFGLMMPDAGSPARRLRRAVTFVAPSVIMAVALVALRTVYFGSAFSAYAGLGRSTGVVESQTRAFVLRSFLPPGSVLLDFWSRHYDVPLIIAAGLAVGVTIWRDRRTDRALAFALLAWAVTLTPALPLSISVSNSVSERFVYAPSVFSSLLVVWLMFRLVPSRAGATACVLVATLVHARALERANNTWREAGELFESLFASTISTIRDIQPGPASRIFILTMPDNLRGAFIARSAIHPAIAVRAPDVPHDDRLVIIAPHDTLLRDDGVVVREIAPGTYDIDVQPNRFVHLAPPTSTEFEFLTWSSGRATVHVRPVGSVVLYASGGRMLRK